MLAVASAVPAHIRLLPKARISLLCVPFKSKSLHFCNCYSFLSWLTADGCMVLKHEIQRVSIKSLWAHIMLADDGNHLCTLYVTGWHGDCSKRGCLQINWWGLPHSSPGRMDWGLHTQNGSGGKPHSYSVEYYFLLFHATKYVQQLLLAGACIWFKNSIWAEVRRCACMTMHAFNRKSHSNSQSYVTYCTTSHQENSMVWLSLGTSSFATTHLVLVLFLQNLCFAENPGLGSHFNLTTQRLAWLEYQVMSFTTQTQQTVEQKLGVTLAKMGWLLLNTMIICRHKIYIAITTSAVLHNLISRQ